MWIMNQPDFVGGIELHQAAQYARYKLDLPKIALSAASSNSRRLSFALRLSVTLTLEAGLICMRCSLSAA